MEQADSMDTGWQGNNYTWIMFINNFSFYTSKGVIIAAISASLGDINFLFWNTFVH